MLRDKVHKEAILIIYKDLKKTMFKESKKGMMIVSHRIEIMKR